MNIATIVHRRARIHADRVAVTDAGDAREYTYRELSQRAAQCARYLARSGVNAGDAVGFLGANSIAALDVMLGCAEHGALFVPLNFRLSAAEIGSVLADAKPAALFADAAFASLVQASSVRAHSTAQPTYLQECAETVQARTAAQTPGEDDQVFALIYTSGSTGAPKGVQQTHRNAFFRALDSIIDFDMTSSDVVLVAAPLFHVAGLNALTLSALHLGGRIVMQPRFDPVQTLDLLERERITCFAVAPTMLKMLAAAPNFAPAKLRGLRFVLVGGEPLESTVQQQWRDAGVELLNVFGMSETTDGALYQRIGDRTPANCVGKPAAHVDFKLVPDGAPGAVGELWIGGPTVSPGYWRDPARTAEVFAGGWVNTGDLACCDAAGDVYIVGRADDMIKSGAEKIAPAELENVIAVLPQVADVVVFGVPHPKWGQAARAVIAVRSGMSLDEKTVLDACAQQLASYKKPQSIVIVEQLPRTGSGKVDRAEIKKRYG